MGKESLKRIAALTAMATMSVMVAGVVNVPALPSLPVTTTVPTTTLPSTTTTVSPTPVTPTTTVTTPTVSTPKVSTPTVEAPPVPTQSSPTSAGGGGSLAEQQTSSAVGTAGGLTSGGTSNTASGAKGTVDEAAETLGGAGGGTLTGGGGAAGGGSSSGNGLNALGFFERPGGPSGTAGSGGDIFGGGPRGGGGGDLPPTLSAADARQLRSALELLEGCMSAIAPLDRQVLSMRAGAGGASPLSRRQVAARLGISTRQVRFSERRGLSDLRTAAEQTGCAGPVGDPFAVSGIGAVALVAFASGPAGVTVAQDGAAGPGGSGYIPARQAEPGSESPLARLTNGGESGPAWLVVLVTVLFSVSIAGLMRELRHSVGP